MKRIILATGLCFLTFACTRETPEAYSSPGHLAVKYTKLLNSPYLADAYDLISPSVRETLPYVSFSAPYDHLSDKSLLKIHEITTVELLSEDGLDDQATAIIKVNTLDYPWILRKAYDAVLKDPKAGKLLIEEKGNEAFVSFTLEEINNLLENTEQEEIQRNMVNDTVFLEKIGDNWFILP